MPVIKTTSHLDYIKITWKGSCLEKILNFSCSPEAEDVTSFGSSHREFVTTGYTISIDSYDDLLLRAFLQMAPVDIQIGDELWVGKVIRAVPPAPRRGRLGSHGYVVKATHRTGEIKTERIEPVYTDEPLEDLAKELERKPRWQNYQTNVEDAASSLFSQQVGPMNFRNPNQLIQGSTESGSAIHVDVKWDEKQIALLQETLDSLKRSLLDLDIKVNAKLSFGPTRPVQ